MNPHGSMPDVERAVEAFEAAARGAGERDPRPFVPPPDHPEYRTAVLEIARADLEFGWERQDPRPLDWYFEAFPDVFSAPEAVKDLAFEEYRQRCQIGLAACPEDYETRYQIDTSDWPVWPLNEEVAGGQRRGTKATGGETAAGQGDKGPFPLIGDCLGDFQLIAELGRGSFARVYLARQGRLAYRFVALKVSTRQTQEPSHLAQLQHTNIVPIYSVHQEGPLQVVCMPFLGSTTLADVFAELRERERRPCTGLEFLSTLAVRHASTVMVTPRAAGIARIGATRSGTPAVKNPVSQLSFEKLVAWIMARIADGVAHAHDHGVIHHDLKPANVLIGDDGQPLILDFNLATKSGDSERFIQGETLPYMAPEHIRAVQSQGVVDERSDIFSVGVMIYEMLTGRTPFPLREGSFSQVAEAMCEDRQSPPVRPRKIDSTISPGLESILLRCLESDPDRRFASARELQLDLDRQLHDLPLRFAPNTSLRERFRKWVRRHPKLTSASTVAGIAACALIALLALFVTRGQTIRRMEAEAQAQRFLVDIDRLSTPLSGTLVDHDSLRSVRFASEQFLNNNGAFIASAISNGYPVSSLAPEVRQQIRESVSRTQYFLCIIESSLADRAKTDDERRRWLEEAWRSIELARALSPSNAVFQLQAAAVRDQVNDAEGTNEFRRRAEQFRRNLVRGDLLQALAFRQSGDLPKAIRSLEMLTRREPGNYAAWFALGGIFADQEKYDDAAGCFTTCIALRPQGHWGYFFRGLTRHQQQRYADAYQDFTEAIEIRPTASAYFNRGLARKALNQLPEAERDFTRAIAAGVPPTRVYFARSRTRAGLGDEAGAAEDWAQGLKLEPEDEVSWIDRGVAFLSDSPEQALANFEEALRLNPDSPAALQNKADVLSERLDRLTEAIATMNQLVRVRSEDARVRVTRGVLRARAGQEAAALDDVRAALQQAQDADTHYRVAGVYSLLSTQKPDYAEMAVHHLREAAWRDPSFVAQMVVHDKDLIPVRQYRGYTDLMEQLSKMQGAAEETNRDG